MLALRIDCLARHAHAFHRFAHHPICNRYTGEVVGFGARWRVCRGCLAAALGSVIGSGVGLSLPPHPRAGLMLGGLATLLGLASLRLRLGKIVARFLPAAFGSAALAGSFYRACGGDRGALLVLAAGLVLSAFCVVTYRLRGPDRTACTRCPERLNTVPCSGISGIVRRERAFQRLSQRWIDAEQGPQPADGIRPNSCQEKGEFSGSPLNEHSQMLESRHDDFLHGFLRMGARHVDGRQSPDRKFLGWNGGVFLDE